MAWQITKRVDDVVILEGPANDDIYFQMRSKAGELPISGNDWTQWTWTGKLVEADGTVVATWLINDLGTTTTELKKEVTLLDATMIPGRTYYAGIRAEIAGTTFNCNYVQLELHPTLIVS